MRGIALAAPDSGGHPDAARRARQYRRAGDAESRAVLLADLDALVAQFNEMRAGEGAKLAEVIGAQIDRIAAAVDAARAAAAEQADAAEDALKAALARVSEAVEVDEARIAQELALLAVKADVTEEFDRLDAHVSAAREPCAEGGPIGRKLDFLSQEFNREANTLCSKSQSAALTRVGLDLKATIDQMREQVQNVE
jgi:uncharacterized protein (TIGR00255 family)